MADIDGCAQAAYANGVSPLDWGITTVHTTVMVFHEVQRARAENPTAFPGYVLEPTDDALARAIVGRLLDAGWTPPNLEQPTDTANGEPTP